MGIYFDQNNRMVFDCRDGIKVINSNCDNIITDIDNNTYQFVTIGTQQWLTSNLKVTHYSDNSPIPNVSNYNDWFMPSKDELNAMRTNLYQNGIGNFISGGDYDSSSESAADTFWAQNFRDGSQYFNAKYDKSDHIRPCRSFTGTTIYSLGDIGPAGGWIFYITNLGGGTYIYYESSPNDYNDVHSYWSNITGTSIGTTSTIIGSGQNNTNAIIAQSGCTQSIASDCDTYTSNMIWTGMTDGTYCWYNNVMNSTSDWFMPSKDELKKIYDNLYLFSVGGLQAWYYYCSSEVNATTVWEHYFPTNSQMNGAKDAANVYCRPVRSFISSSVLNLRDNGPGGGLIFHIIDNGNGTYTYYEASLSDVSHTAWSNVTGSTAGASGTAIGTGQANTTAIITQSGHTTSSAKLCDDLTITGYKSPYGALYNWYAVDKKFDDWFLPSRDEIEKMRTELYSYGYGAFGSGGTPYYWCSTEDSGGNPTWAYLMYFNLGYSSVQTKGTKNAVRACRKFTSSTPYNLRDIGPAGGWIFYITGSTYYEAAPSDQANSQAWSNITGTTVGTASIIGTGMTNTVAIIAQVGHTSSAAKLCSDYTGNQKLVYLKQNGVYDPGWRIPTQSDFTTLSTYLSGDSVAGGKLKETGTTHWTSPNTGATDSYGFIGVPGGYRVGAGAYGGQFSSIYNACYLQSSTQSDATHEYLRSLLYNAAAFTESISDKNMGFSIRCVKDV